MLKVKSPIVELDGDEMTRIIWKLIKDELILPYLDIDLIYFDLGLKNRDKTNDKVTVDASLAIKKYKVGVKCATITPNTARVKEYKLKKQYKSPNATIREKLDGTIFRKPIIVKNIPPMVRSWKKPITIARHAYGDIYKNSETKVKKGQVFLSLDSQKLIINKFTGPGVVQAIFNTDKSITNFAKSCINYSLAEKIDLWFATKDTISKTYHARFRDIFQKEVDRRKKEFKKTKIEYFYTLIDDAVARVMRHKGGFLWACMNYDGDIMSDMLASGFGSLGLMTSMLASPTGAFEYEAAHGTVQKHYYKHLKGQPTSTNSVATIFAWTGALKKRGALDHTPKVINFATNLEQATIQTIESGYMTGDLIKITSSKNPKKLNTKDFILKVKQNFTKSFVL